MEIVVRVGKEEYDIVLGEGSGRLTLAELVALVDPSGAWAQLEAPPICRVDGRPVMLTAEVSEAPVRRGSIIELGFQPADPPAAPQGGSEGGSSPVARLEVVGGPAAGAAFDLAAGRHAWGRAERAGIRIGDPTLSPVHGTLVVEPDGIVHLLDLGSLNGTTVAGRLVPVTGVVVGAGDLVRAGSAELTVSPWPPHRDDAALARPGPDGTAPFNRPPRGARPPAPDPVAVPEPPKAPPARAVLNMAAVLAPLALAGAMVWLLGNVRFVLFALLSPVLAVATWLGTRRRQRRELQHGRQRLARDLARFEAELAAAAAQQRAGLEQVLPPLPEVLRRAAAPSTRLWERRLGDDDALVLRVGAGDVPVTPPVDERAVGANPDLGAVVARYRVLPSAPASVELRDGGVVGIVGARGPAVALARALLVQAAVHHGPADLAVVVVTTSGGVREWDWAKWLPHARAEDPGAWMLAAEVAASRRLLEAMLAVSVSVAGPVSVPKALAPAPTRTVFLVVDDLRLVSGRAAAARALLRGEAGPVAGIVLAPSVERLPSVCDTVVMLPEPGCPEPGAIVRPRTGERTTGVRPAGLSAGLARTAARALARHDDPELAVSAAALPDVVHLGALLGLGPALGQPESDAWAAVIGARWRDSAATGAVATPLGVGEAGVVSLDLARDGPHALIGGTTGSGKSELLRSLVAGLAVGASPDDLVFVLIDYKGGSAFDECARLPHTVGLVTDLDGHLGQRALRSLEAELRHRERMLRAAAATDLAHYRILGRPAGPLPRLAVVIDEFATLAAELPDFLGALVGIAQRGRSLGVHLVLATQRPQGSVNAAIRANTNVRVALRVQDNVDSTDVIDRPDAAAIARHRPGRAYLRLGPGEVIALQTAYSGSTEDASGAPATRPRYFCFGPDGGRAAAVSVAPDTPGPEGPRGGEPAASELARLVDAIEGAHRRWGSPPPRRPWLAMLPLRLPWDEVGDPVATNEAALVPIGHEDDPDAQVQRAWCWRPDEGSLALFGMVGAGTTTALAAAVLAIAQRFDPDGWHLYVLDLGGGLGDLAALAHVGAVIGGAEQERQHRLIRRLWAETVRRRQLSAAARADQPRLVVAIDGLPALMADHAGLEGTEVSEALRRILTEGPAVGVVCVFTAERPGAVPHRIAGAISQRLLFRLADPLDFTMAGLRVRDLPALNPGRAVDAGTGRVVQVAWPGEDRRALVTDLVTRWPTSSRAPEPVAELPIFVPAHRLGRAPVGPEELHGPFTVPLGLAEQDLAPVGLTLHPGEHLLVAGQPRSGVSTALGLLAARLREAWPEAVIVGVTPTRSPLVDLSFMDAVGRPGELAPVLAAACREAGRRWFVLVDDASRVEEPIGLEPLLSRAHVTVIAGGRADDLRGAFGHWSRSARQSRTGILLMPRLDVDGELLGVRLPRRLAVGLVPGRGFVVQGGEPILAQLAHP